MPRGDGAAQSRLIVGLEEEAGAPQTRGAAEGSSVCSAGNPQVRLDRGAVGGPVKLAEPGQAGTSAVGRRHAAGAWRGRASDVASGGPRHRTVGRHCGLAEGPGLPALFDVDRTVRSPCRRVDHGHGRRDRRPSAGTGAFHLLRVRWHDASVALQDAETLVQVQHEGGAVRGHPVGAPRVDATVRCRRTLRGGVAVARRRLAQPSTGKLDSHRGFARTRCLAEHRPSRSCAANAAA